MPMPTLEYLRRNMNVCKAVGAHANAKAALKRLQAQKRPAKWLVEYLEGIVSRTEPLAHELAMYRATTPIHKPPCIPGCYCHAENARHSPQHNEGLPK